MVKTRNSEGRKAEREMKIIKKRFELSSLSSMEIKGKSHVEAGHSDR